MEGGLAGGGAAADLCRDMAAVRAACEQRIAQGRDRTAAAASAFRGAVLSARSLASGSVAHREKLNALKDQLRGMEAGLTEAVSTQLKKESECKLTRESISNATATNEQLRGLLLEQRARRDELASVISLQLEATEALEANVDAMRKKNLDEAIMWYNKFLGFRVVAGEGVKFVFNKVDMQSPDDEYSFCIKVNKDEYSLIQCIPLLKDTEELVKDLNRTNDLFKFVRTMRARFQSAGIKGVHPGTSLCTDTSSTPISSPPAVSVDTTSEGTTNQSRTRSRSKNKDLHSKRGVSPRSTASPLTSVSSTRRSPRLAAADAGSRH